jgi:hypothetical protein
MHHEICLDSAFICYCRFNICLCQLCSLVLFGTADINQERIVEEGGLDALLSVLETSENTTIHRVTAGAVANLAMNGNVF